MNDRSPAGAVGKRDAPGQIPLNFFGIAFGLLGLADCWLVAAQFALVTVTIGEVLNGVAALAWLVVLVAYGISLRSRPGGLAADLADPVGAPFASLIVIVPMLAAADGIYPHAAGAGRVIVDVGIAVTMLVGGWFTGEWIYRPVPLAAVHSGYFLPAAAGGFIASASAALVGQLPLARVLFGVGLFAWLVFGSVVLGRLILGPPLPAPLMPTLAIQVAPAGVATFAYFAIDGDRIDLFAALIAGYGCLMVLTQIRLLPAYLRLPFMPSFWAFAFAWSAVAFGSMFWLHAGHPAGWHVYCFVLLAAISLLVAVIAGRTAIAFGRGEFLPTRDIDRSTAALATDRTPYGRDDQAA